MAPGSRNQSSGAVIPTASLRPGLTPPPASETETGEESEALQELAAASTGESFFPSLSPVKILPFFFHNFVTPAPSETQTLSAQPGARSPCAAEVLVDAASVPSGASKR